MTHAQIDDYARSKLPDGFMLQKPERPVRGKQYVRFVTHPGLIGQTCLAVSELEQRVNQDVNMQHLIETRLANAVASLHAEGR